MSSPLRMSFARLCRETRALLDITQRELAAATGLSRSHIAEIETGHANPTLDQVARIGEALGLDLQLVGRPPVVLDPRSNDTVPRCWWSARPGIGRMVMSGPYSTFCSRWVTKVLFFGTAIAGHSPSLTRPSISALIPAPTMCRAAT